MPGGDRTGPMGAGPMTGRGMGYCGGSDAPGWANWGPGRRLGAMRGFGLYGRGPRGRGMRGGWGAYGPGPGGGWGWRHWTYTTGLPRWARSNVAPAWAYGLGAGPPSEEQEVEMLREEAEWLKQQLDTISGRLAELSEE
jgi:hypothetical protein